MSYRKELSDILIEFGRDLSKKGYRVYIYDNDRQNSFPTYLIIGNKENTDLSYMQIETLGSSFTYSTIHKPSRVGGTGSRSSESIEPSEKDVIQAFGGWSIAMEGKHRFIPKRYKNIDEYLQRETVLNYINIDEYGEAK